MRPFDYHRAATAQQACELLAQAGGNGRVLAGGQSLLNMMKLRIVSPAALVDASRVRELKGVVVTAPEIRIGSMATYAELETHVRGRPGAEIFTDALHVIADMHVRHVGTVGGSSCHADPFADMPNVLAVLNADFEVLSIRGQRRVATEQFFTGPFETALGVDELLASIHVPALPIRTGGAYEKFSWRSGDYAIASVACVLTLDERGLCDSARLVAGSLGSGPERLRTAEESLIGERLSERAVAAAAAAASRACSPQADPIYGSVEYKRCLIETLTVRATSRALDRARASLGAEYDA